MIEMTHSHRPDRRSLLQIVILWGLCFYFVWLLAGGRLANYINLRFAWLSVVAAVSLLLLACWQTAAVLRRRHQHEHGGLAWGVLAIMSVPLLLALLIPAQPLGVEAVSGGVRMQPVGGARTTATFFIDPQQRNVLDWLRAFEQAQNPAELDGLPVDVIGFIYREPGMADSQFMVARFTLSCCVADALAIGMPVQNADAVALPDGAWVHIEGILQAGDFDGAFLPLIRPTTITPIDPPQNPYLYS